MKMDNITILWRKYCVTTVQAGEKINKDQSGLPQFPGGNHIMDVMPRAVFDHIVMTELINILLIFYGDSSTCV